MPGIPLYTFIQLLFESYAGNACTLFSKSLSKAMPDEPVRFHKKSFSRTMLDEPVRSHTTFFRKLYRGLPCTLSYSFFSRVMPATPIRSLQNLFRKLYRT